MIIAVELAVTLKIPDVVAISARQTLRRRLGHAALAELGRADWWRLELEAADADAALDLGRELAEATNCFVNPNKHVYRIGLTTPLPPPREGLRTVAVLTGFHDDATAELTAQALRGRLGYGERVRRVELGTLWVFQLAVADDAAARALAEQMTVTRSQHEGLLVNPHSMWWRPVSEAAA